MIWQIIFLAIFFIFLYYIFQGNKNLPPGEYGLPILGVFLRVKGNLRDFLYKLRAKQGNICGVKIGTRVMVFLRDLDTIRHFSRIELSGRPEIYQFQASRFFLPGGILFTHGPVWESNRRFALRHLKEFGFGKMNNMQMLIQREVEEFIASLKPKVGQPTEIGESLNIAALNVVWGLIAGMRFDQSDEKLQKLVENFYKVEKLGAGPMRIMIFFPILAKILPNFVKNNWMKVDQLFKLQSELHQMLREIIEEHKKTLDTSNPKDYIDAQLVEMEEKKDLNLNSVDRMSNLVVCAIDLYVAGMETTATTLKWFTLLMAAHPEVQARVQKELDEFLPSDQLMPLAEDRSRFHYLQATMHEVMRFKTIVPFALIHSALEDYYLDGYKIPKDAIVVSCLGDIHHDPKYWEKPEEFNPDRFLDKDGSLKKLPDYFIPFGYGKRLCLGEAVARMEVFMFAGGILSNFNVRFPDDAQVNLNSDTSSFHINFPHPFKVILENRK